MSILARPAAASFAAKTMQRAVALASRRTSGRGSVADRLARFPEYPRRTRRLTIPTSVADAPLTVYLPSDAPADPPPVHVNFHGGGYIMSMPQIDDALCRFLAAEAGVVVVNVKYVVAPQHPFPEPPRQTYEVVRWVAEAGAQQGWDGGRLTVGGQSAGGGLATAVARQALEEGGPAIALQVLHYPPLDLVTPARSKTAAISRPMLRPWMADVFNSAYVPDPPLRADRLVSPAYVSDTAELKGIAPALVVTAAHDLLREEGVRYAERLERVGALVEHFDVVGADHGYDDEDEEKARVSYGLMARRIGEAVGA